MKKISLLSLLLIFIFIISSKANDDLGSVYQIMSEESKSVPREYYSFLEGVSHQLTYQDLSEAKWSSKMETPQSFYDGYWVRLKVKNKTNKENLGLIHRWNFEKRIIYKNTNKIYSFPLVRSMYNNYTHRSEDRIWYNYKIIMPKDELIEIYSYFRSQPLDRNQIFEGVLDWMAIGLW